MVISGSEAPNLLLQTPRGAPSGEVSEAVELADLRYAVSIHIAAPLFLHLRPFRVLVGAVKRSVDALDIVTLWSPIRKVFIAQIKFMSNRMGAMHSFHINGDHMCPEALTVAICPGAIHAYTPRLASHVRIIDGARIVLLATPFIGEIARNAASSSCIT